MTDEPAIGTVMRAMRKGDRVFLYVGDRTIGHVTLAHVPNGMKTKVAFSFDKSVRIEADKPDRRKHAVD